MRFAHPGSPSSRSVVSKLRAFALAALFVPASVLGTAAPASAEPAPVDISYADCPAAPPAVGDPSEYICEVFVLASGNMRFGRIDQPIDKPITMTVLAHIDPRTGAVTETMLKWRAPQLSVPGGLLGIPGTDSLSVLKLKATPEYAGNFGWGLAEDNTTLRATVNLQLKVANLLLPGSCGIGSAADPIKLNLIIDPKSLKLYDGDVLGGSISDNTFSVPATSGCGLFGPLADWRSGVPSAGGQNSTTQQMYLGAKTYGQGVSKAAVPGLSTLMADARD
ncbi:hypothetical protein [Actinocorallia populi]|uniref:hypothetical protein n=1 Tax=Actinocorallia populi TaxID=2079200 RepID=UPI000D092361|nr:hypothetical protein [Actinocorallia populi]